MTAQEIAKTLIAHQHETYSFRIKQWEKLAHPDTAMAVFEILVQRKAWDSTQAMVAQHVLAAYPETQEQLMAVAPLAVSQGLLETLPIPVQPAISLLDYIRQHHPKQFPILLGKFMDQAIITAQFGAKTHLLAALVDVPEFKHTRIQNGQSQITPIHAWCRDINIIVLNQNLANWKAQLGLILRSGIEVDAVAHMKNWKQQWPCTALAWCAARYNGEHKDTYGTRHLKTSIVELVAHGADWRGLDDDKTVSGRLINALPQVVAYKRAQALEEVAQIARVGDSGPAPKPKF